MTKSKKLSLAKETLQRISGAELQGVGGAITEVTNCGSCHTCNCQTGVLCTRTCHACYWEPF